MPQATIDVKFINDPKPGKRNKTAKTADGKSFSFDPAKVNLSDPGQYVIEWHESSFNNSDGQAIRVNYLDKLVKKVEAPKPTNGSQGGGGFSSPMELFVRETIVSALYQTGGANFPNGEHMTTMVTTARLAWEMGMKSTAAPQQGPTALGELNDEIPW